MLDLIEIKECDKCDLCEDHHDMPISDAEDERYAKLRAACEAALKAMDKADYGLDVYALAPNLKRAAEQLREALNQ